MEIEKSDDDPTKKCLMEEQLIVMLKFNEETKVSTLKKCMNFYCKFN